MSRFFPWLAPSIGKARLNQSATIRKLDGGESGGPVTKSRTARANIDMCFSRFLEMPFQLQWDGREAACERA
ncbi:hypothetical protein A3768_5202 (plasmid) [Ralstonia solanacearum]|nr:hypothetical protein A3768_5202 [Ralstonia solanacearum]ARU25036.1 hypothetical protein RSSE_p0846 [Ralstonia solanacearum]